MAESYSLPDGWRWAKLGSVLQSHRGGVWGAPSQTGQGYPVLRSTNMRGGRLDFSEVAWCDVSKTIAQSAILEVGDILVSKSSGSPRLVGLPALFTGSPDGHSYLFSNFTMRLRPDQSLVHSEYLFHFLSGAKAEAERRNMARDTAGLRNLKTREYLQQDLPLPPLSEQDRITKAIAHLCAQSRTAREALDRVPTLLKRFRQAVLAAAFCGELTERDPNDEPAATLLERIHDERQKDWKDSLYAKGKDSKNAKFSDTEPLESDGLATLPQGWQWAAVAQFAEVHLGRQRSPARATGPYMMPYLRAANVTWGGLGLSDVKQMDFSPAEQEIYRLRPGDLVLSEASGSPSEVGKPALWNDEIPGCCIQNTLIRVRSEGPLPKYLFYHFLNDALAARFGQASQGIQINHLGAKGLSSWPVSLAPLAEQQRIVARIEVLLTQADAIKRAVEVAQKRAEKVDQAILARAFRGEL